MSIRLSYFSNLIFFSPITYALSSTAVLRLSNCIILSLVCLLYRTLPLESHHFLIFHSWFYFYPLTGVKKKISTHFHSEVILLETLCWWGISGTSYVCFSDSFFQETCIYAERLGLSHHTLKGRELQIQNHLKRRKC